LFLVLEAWSRRFFASSVDYNSKLRSILSVSALNVKQIAHFIISSSLRENVTASYYTSVVADAILWKELEATLMTTTFFSSVCT
jgi:hypothetical protein